MRDKYIDCAALFERSGKMITWFSLARIITKILSLNGCSTSNINVTVKPISQLRFGHDTTTIRRYHDAFDYDESDRNYDMRSIRVRYDYDTTTTKKWYVHTRLLGIIGVQLFTGRFPVGQPSAPKHWRMFIFLLASNRVEWKQAHAIRSRIWS